MLPPPQYVQHKLEALRESTWLEDFVPEARKFMGALDDTKCLCQPQVRPLVLVTQLPMQSIPLRIAMHLLHLQAFYAIAREPLIAAADQKDVLGYIFGFLWLLTAIAPYCGLPEHLILDACMCTACLACYCLRQAVVLSLHGVTCKHKLAQPQFVWSRPFAHSTI